MRRVGQLLVLTLVLLIPARDAIPAADDFAGKVVGVHDGDAITVVKNRMPVKEWRTGRALRNQLAVVDEKPLRFLRRNPSRKPVVC